MNFETSVGGLTEPVSGRHWSRREIQQQIAIRKHAFLTAGIEPGDRVLILFGNRLEFFAELLAIWGLGGCAIPVDARLTAFELSKLLESAQARFSVIDDHTSAETRTAVAPTVIRHTLEPSGDAAAGAESSQQGPHPRLDDDALILFTSGSTGDPKGVVHTHRSLLARWVTLKQSLGLDRYRRSLCLLPTHFGHGLICNCLFPWLSGCELFIAPPFKPELIMRLGSLIDEYRISFMSSVPSVWNLALPTASPPERGSLERVHVGSAPLSKNIWTRIQQWTGTSEVFNAYGITETGSWVAGTTGGEVVPESGMIGEPWGASIRVLEAADPDNPIEGGRECETGQTGMVWLHTPALMKGYFQRPDLTDAAVRQGWFMTGDIGLIDERGWLFLKGRERDEINKGGLKVFPADVDEVVEQFSSTRDVCTFGFEDAFYGENVGLAVVLADTGNETVLGLYDWIASHLAEHKHPAQWYLLDEIPRTSRGKVNRASVRQACQSVTPLNIREILSGRSGGSGQ
jgi:acyl-CoA synthetase (AMP-forming)/AMP-acid ligase II